MIQKHESDIDNSLNSVFSNIKVFEEKILEIYNIKINIDNAIGRASEKEVSLSKLNNIISNIDMEKEAITKLIDELNTLKKYSEKTRQEFKDYPKEVEKYFKKEIKETEAVLIKNFEANNRIKLNESLEEITIIKNKIMNEIVVYADKVREKNIEMVVEKLKELAGLTLADANFLRATLFQKEDYILNEMSQKVDKELVRLNENFDIQKKEAHQSLGVLADKIAESNAKLFQINEDKIFKQIDSKVNNKIANYERIFLVFAVLVVFMFAINSYGVFGYRPNNNQSSLNTNQSLLKSSMDQKIENTERELLSRIKDNEGKIIELNKTLLKLISK